VKKKPDHISSDEGNITEGEKVLKKQPRTKDIDVNFIEVKTHTDKSNSKLNEKKWSETEKRQLDKYVLGWARWEVDYANGFVRSAKCEGTTKNIAVL
jgi:hypothetical protein